MDSLAEQYDRRNLTEPRRMAYRLGWALAARWELRRYIEFSHAWPSITAVYPEANRAECEVAFTTARSRRPVEVLTCN